MVARPRNQVRLRNICTFSEMSRTTLPKLLGNLVLSLTIHPSFCKISRIFMHMCESDCNLG
jgi:hypothetical protein